MDAEGIVPMVLLLDRDLILRRLVSPGADPRIEGIAGRPLAQIDLPWNARLAQEAALVRRSGEMREIPLEGGLGARLVPDAQGEGVAILIDRATDRRDSPEGALSAARHQFINSLQLMRAVIRRSAEGASDVETYSQQLEGRLDALSRILGTLIRDPGARFALSGLIYDALEEQGLSCWPGCPRITGPDIRIPGRPAQTLALLFHELASDAVQHGVLDADHCENLTVTWQHDADTLRIHWTEHDRHQPPGTPVLAMDEVMAYDLDGNVRRETRANGLTVTIELPGKKMKE